MSVAICERFKAVADRAAERPQTAEELIEIKSFVDGADRIVEDILVDVGRVRTQVRVSPGVCSEGGRGRWTTYDDGWEAIYRCCSLRKRRM